MLQLLLLYQEYQWGTPSILLCLQLTHLQELDRPLAAYLLPFLYLRACYQPTC
jgi:hypothetical protein